MVRSYIGTFWSGLSCWSLCSIVSHQSLKPNVSLWSQVSHVPRTTLWTHGTLLSHFSLHSLYTRGNIREWNRCQLKQSKSKKVYTSGAIADHKHHIHDRLLVLVCNGKPFFLLVLSLHQVQVGPFHRHLLVFPAQHHNTRLGREVEATYIMSCFSLVSLLSLWSRWSINTLHTYMP